MFARRRGGVRVHRQLHATECHSHGFIHAGHQPRAKKRTAPLHYSDVRGTSCRFAFPVTEEVLYNPSNALFILAARARIHDVDLRI